MKAYTADSKSAIVILHEIYGINRFIEDICAEYHRKGHDVYCPDFLRRTFSYGEKKEAYAHFYSEVGLDRHTEITHLAEQLKVKYESVFLLGFSVGATLAWRCCEQTVFDGIVCCYGSRIRDYLYLQPKCPMLLLFAEHDSFDTGEVCRQLSGRQNMEIHVFDACHGFMDRYSECYDAKNAKTAKAYMDSFLQKRG